MTSFTSKNGSIIFSISNSTITKNYLSTDHFFPDMKFTLNLDDITKIETFPGPIYIGSTNKSLVLNKEDFTTDAWVKINAELSHFRTKHEAKINKNLTNSVISKIEECYGLEAFKDFVRNAPLKELHQVKGDGSLFGLGVLIPILFKGESGWFAATPFAKEIYDSIIQKGL